MKPHMAVLLIVALSLFAASMITTVVVTNDAESITGFAVEETQETLEDDPEESEDEEDNHG